MQYEFNGRARQESIESGLTQLADISDGFIEKAFSRKMKLAEATGKAAAAGMTGVTADRFDLFNVVLLVVTLLVMERVWLC